METNRRKMLLIGMLLGVASAAGALSIIFLSQSREVWHRFMPGTDTYPGPAVAMDPDGNIYLTSAFLVSGYYDTDAFLAKYDPTGNQLWYRTYGGNDSDRGNGVAVANDGTVYLVGSSHDRYFISRYDSSGTRTWTRLFGLSGESYDKMVITDGGFFLAGYTNLIGGTLSYILAKYDGDGNSIWNRTCEAGNSYNLFGIAVVGDGSAYIGGSVYNAAIDDNDAFLIKYDSLGNCMWNTTWNNAGNEWGTGVAVAADGSVFLAGSCYSYEYYNYNAFIVKYNAAGKQLWSHMWDGGTADSGASIVGSLDGGVYLVGTTQVLGSANNDAFIAKYDAAGKYLWSRYYGGSNSESSFCGASASDGNMYLVGVSYYQMNTEIFLAKMPGRSPEVTAIVILLVIAVGITVSLVAIGIHDRQASTRDLRVKEVVYRSKSGGSTDESASRMILEAMSFHLSRTRNKNRD